MLKSLRRLHGKLSGGLITRHPDFVELVAYRDGELNVPRGTSIAQHLQDCSGCQATASRIELALENGARAAGETAAVPAAGEGLERLLRVIRDESLLAAEQERLRRERNHRIVAELRTYFGSYPELLLRISPEEGPVFRAEVGRLAQSFLGRTAASALLGRIDPEMGRA
jgi:anti-sigma factor RsiW